MQRKQVRVEGEECILGTQAIPCFTSFFFFETYPAHQKIFLILLDKTISRMYKLISTQLPFAHQYKIVQNSHFSSQSYSGPVLSNWGWFLVCLCYHTAEQL